MIIKIDRDLKIKLLKALQSGIIDLSIFDTKEAKIRALTPQQVEYLKSINNQVVIFELPDNGRPLIK